MAVYTTQAVEEIYWGKADVGAVAEEAAVAHPGLLKPPAGEPSPLT